MKFKSWQYFQILMDDCPIVYRIPHNVWELICRMLIEPEKPYWNVDSSGYYIRCLRAASKFFCSTVNQCLLQFPMVLKERSFDGKQLPKIYMMQLSLKSIFPPK